MRYARLMCDLLVISPLTVLPRYLCLQAFVITGSRRFPKSTTRGSGAAAYVGSDVNMLVLLTLSSSPHRESSSHNMISIGIASLADLAYSSKSSAYRTFSRLQKPPTSTPNSRNRRFARRRALSRPALNSNDDKTSPCLTSRVILKPSDPFTHPRWQLYTSERSRIYSDGTFWLANASNSA